MILNFDNKSFAVKRCSALFCGLTVALTITGCGTTPPPLPSGERVPINHLEGQWSPAENLTALHETPQEKAQKQRKAKQERIARKQELARKLREQQLLEMQKKAEQEKTEQQETKQLPSTSQSKTSDTKKLSAAATSVQSDQMNQQLTKVQKQVQTTAEEVSDIKKELKK